MMGSARAVRHGQTDFYDAHAEEYCRLTAGLDMSGVYQKFLTELASGSHILDAGCGSGRDTKAFLNRGFVVTAFDASPQMAAFATKYTGQPCRVLRFQRVESREEFDAIWACASLLHVPKAEMKDVLLRLWAALKPGGIMYASFIEGAGERISQDGRRYNSYTAKSLGVLLKQIPGIREMVFWHSDEVSPAVQRAPWLNCLLRKVGHSC